MSFNVLWSLAAVASLQEIFDRSQRPEDIIGAVKDIGQRLQENPSQQGESRTPGQRIIFSPPLGALFEVHWRLNEVKIVLVWSFEQHDQA